MGRGFAALLSIAVVLTGCQSPPNGQEAANKEVVRRFTEAVNDRDLDALDELVTPDVVRHSPSTPDVQVRNLDQLKAFLRQNVASLPDEAVEIRTMLAEGDQVAVWANYTGTQEGPMGPFPASGRTVDLDFASILRLENGRIAEMWVVWDNVSMLTQLGHMQPPGAPGPDSESGG